MNCFIKSFFVFSILLFLSACSINKNKKNEVIVYVSVDQVFSSKILKQFEKKTGIKVRAVYDTEATKAIGLEKRILAERKHPQADLFWNSEFLRTERLAQMGVLKELDSLKHIFFKKMGLRSRVFIVNTNLVKQEEYPNTLHDLINVKYKDRIALSTPYAGTASTHFAALYSKLGKNEFIHFIKGLKKNKVAFLSGNSVVKDAVGQGRYPLGLVDTDDALLGIKQGLPIKMIYYDQNKCGMFSIYQTVSIIKNSPHPRNAQKLLDYLVTPQIEQELIKMNAVQFPLLQVSKHTHIPKIWTLPAEDVLQGLKPSIKIMRNYLE